MRKSVFRVLTRSDIATERRCLLLRFRYSNINLCSGLDYHWGHPVVLMSMNHLLSKTIGKGWLHPDSTNNCLIGMFNKKRKQTYIHISM